MGTAVEHHTLYQYRLRKTGSIFMGQIQTETPYYQPNHSAPIPFPPDATYHDPVFKGVSSTWDLRIVDSTDVLVYGAGLYSFFSNYNVSCSDVGNGENERYASRTSSAYMTAVRFRFIISTLWERQR